MKKEKQKRGKKQIVLIVAGIVIGVLDFVFGKGLSLLGTL